VSGTRCEPDGFGRRLRCVGTIVILSALAVSAPVLNPPAAAHPAPDGFADLAERLLPAVVNVSTSQTIKPDAKPKPEAPAEGTPFEEFFKQFMERQNHSQAQPERSTPHKAVSLGSGFIIDTSGLVVTNNHVIDGADEITVILQDDTNLKAEVVGRDTKVDLALLKVKTDHPLVAVSFGDSDKSRVGEWVMAVGNPYGLGGTVTAGIVSARAREINNNEGIYDDFIQTDAAINRGNSGGPLFNMDGEVIGINTAIFSPSGGSIGIGFAIPSQLASNIIGQIRAFGHTRRGWLGARIESVNDDIAEAFGLEKPKGVVVAGLIEQGPAQKAGLQAGDVLLAIDGRDVPDARHFERMVADEPIDRQIKVTIWRKHQQKLIDVKVGELDEGDHATQTASLAKPDQKTPPPSQTKALGLLFAEATPELREKYQLGDSATVVITDVTKGSAAEDRDLKAGDVVVEVAEQEVKSPDDITKRIDEARKAGRKSILLLVDRAGDLRFVALRIDQG
jgi:serine protease Do